MKTHVGIVGTGIYLPKGIMTAKEIAEKNQWYLDRTSNHRKIRYC